jgi:hypothetical protein
MITEIRNNYLYIWRDREEKDSGLEVRVSSDKGLGALKKLEDRISTWKFYPALKAISDLRTFHLEWRDGINEWESGLPNLVNRNISTPEHLKYDPNKAYSNKREKKDPPLWFSYISREIKDKKQKIDYEDKLDSKLEDHDSKKTNRIFKPYPQDIFDGYAKAKIEFYKDRPDYKPASWENPGIISKLLTKSIIWGVMKKYRNILNTSKSPWELENAGKIYRMQIGKLRSNEEFALNALRKFDAPSALLTMERDEEEEDKKDSYLTSQAIETENNKLFNTLDIKTKNAIMKAAGLTQDDINKRNAAIFTKSDAGTVQRGHKDEDYYYNLGDIFKQKESLSFWDILSMHLTEQLLQEITLENREIEVNTEKDIREIINNSSFKGLKIIFETHGKEDYDSILGPYNRVIISKSIRKRDCFQITFIDDDEPVWHITITENMEPTLDNVNVDHVDTVELAYIEFIERLEQESHTSFIKST